jgi:hypothetical protein
MAVGGSLLPRHSQKLFGQQGSVGPAAPLAAPIRGLVARDGTLLQPIHISVNHIGPSATAVTKVDGAEVDRRVLTQGGSFQIFTPPVTSPKDVNVTVIVGDTDYSTVVTLKPVRKVLVYILPHSHHDLGYTALQPTIEEKQVNNISLAIELARKTASYPKGARFIWNLEVLWSADLYMRRKSQAEKDALLDAVKKGWVSINGMYANELTGLCRPEELLQLFRYSFDLSRQCGVTVDSAMLSDVPGYTWGTITAMSQAGIRYFSAAPNNSDRIGTIRPVWHDKPFWHVSRSGKEKVLVWMPGHGYSSWAAGNAEMAAGCQEYLDSVNFPYSISYIRWSGHGDNAVPDPQIAEFVKTWNQEYVWPQFAIASTSTAFAALEEKHGSELPEFKGDLTPYWEDGAGSSALETGINRNSADRLAQAAALAAMFRTGAPGAVDFRNAWRDVLLYSEHTWGASASVRDPDSPMTKGQWAIKRQFALDGEKESEDLIAEMLRARAAGAGNSSIDVINSTSWPRTEVIFLSKELSAAGDHVTDSHGSSLPSQRLSTGELAFLASDIPPFGSARFHLSAGKSHIPSKSVAVRDGLILENGIVRAGIDANTGNVVELTLHGNSANLIDTSRGGAANEFLFVQGKDFAEMWNLQNEGKGLQYQDLALDGSDIGQVLKNGPVHISIEEAGPLVASLRIESSAPGCNRLVRRLRLLAGADWVELCNSVDKKPAPRNPYPPNTAGAWSQYGGKEGVHFAFPFAVPDGDMHMDIPLAEMRPELDQLSGANKNWLPVGRWIDVANEKLGVTWVTLDAPLVEIGEISATLVGSNHNPLLWRKRIAPTQKFYSWVMNNHWETNYRGSQEGLVEFRYALRAHGGYDPAAASRFSIALSQPLLASGASAELPAASLLSVDPPDVLVIALKPSDDGKATIIRLFGASGENRKARLRWSSPVQPRIWRSDLSERTIEPMAGEIPVDGWDVVILRAELPSRAQAIG